MKTILSRSIMLLAALIFSASYLYGQQKLPVSPKDHFGFTPGDDRILINYSALTGYLQDLDNVSDMVKMIEIGNSPMGKPMYIVFVSSTQNIAQLDKLKEINKRLALDPNIGESERSKIIESSPVFVMASHSLHSTEVAPAITLPLIAYDLITTNDKDVKKIMDDVVFMIIPNPNPDGMDLVYDNYMKNLGTKYEGASLPHVYHKYVGHDNNRDFVILSQEDTKVMSRITSHDWFPQVYVDKHQMGSTGIRYFVPPLHDPIAEAVEGELWSWTGVFGSNMLKDLTAEGNKGVGTHTIFDLYWPGASLTSIWKNVIGMLTEAASVKTATPIFIEPNELSVGGKGLSEYKKGVNLPDPWEGGWWRLGDIVKYEISSTMSVLKTASQNREAILTFRNEIAKKEIHKGLTMAPYYYVLPKYQRDVSEFVDLVNLLREHGISVYELKEKFKISGEYLFPGDIVVPLAQPFRPFIKEVMEAQEFPVRHYTPDGEIITPYDITSWSLPLHRNVKCLEISELNKEFSSKLVLLDKDYSLAEESFGKFESVVFSANYNGSYKAAFSALNNGIKVARISKELKIGEAVIPSGSFIVDGNARSAKWLSEFSKEAGFSPDFAGKNLLDEGSLIELPRIALVETYFRNMDAGWTRFLLDSYGLPFTVLHPGDFKNVDFKNDYDVVIIPSASKELLLSGKMRPDGSYTSGSAHPDHIKGMGPDGLKKLVTFISTGGKVIAWGDAVELFVGKLTAGDEDFHFPFRQDRSPAVMSVSVPGSLLRGLVTEDTPLTYGMPSEIGLYFNNSPVFGTSVPGFDVDRRVIVKFPEKDILMSGYAENGEALGNKSAMIWLRKGKGQLVLFGFGPQFRASTQGTYKLLFNSILLPDLK